MSKPDIRKGDFHMKKTTINTELTAIDMLNEVLSDLDALEQNLEALRFQ